MSLTNSFTSTGSKLWAHQEAMRDLRDGKGRPIVTHLIPTDVCQHRCAFCSVQARAGDVLPLADLLAYTDILCRYGLKAAIISGGGNPLLYRCPDTGATLNDLVRGLKERGLEIGLITNGMPLKRVGDRWTWRGIEPATLDACTWIRVSLAGLDHREETAYVPDVDPAKTTLGFSYVYHDIYEVPEEPHHGKVSTEADLVNLGLAPRAVRRGEDRLPWLEAQFRTLIDRHQPAYLRLLPNCLEPKEIPARCETLRAVAARIDPARVFVQEKPPRAPRACYLGVVHPVLNACGGIFPCDSVVLNEAAGHKFGNPWRVCHWSEVAKLYEEPVHSLIDPQRWCEGCVFSTQNALLDAVVTGTEPIPPAPAEAPVHVNFV